MTFSLSFDIGPLSLAITYGAPEETSEYVDLSTEHERLPVGFAPSYSDDE